jgi:hypothetical protein
MFPGSILLLLLLHALNATRSDLVMIVHFCCRYVDASLQVLLTSFPHDLVAELKTQQLFFYGELHNKSFG